MHIEYDDIQSSVQFCYDVIGKEVKQDNRLVRQVLLTLLSAYTKNPINLAINAPTGEGKSYVVSKVADLFPKTDIIFLSAMTDKALFHRQGILVIKNEIGEYEPADYKIKEIDSEIEDKESELSTTTDKNLNQGLRSIIKELEKKKKETLKDARKLIDLNNKVLIFADTPKHTLLEAIMSLLGHDRYEVEYEFVDTFNGIRTKNNILRGFPTVIFTAAIDYSKYPRWAEIQRRFIITNPKMTAEKYKESIHLVGARFGLPQFAYDAMVVSENEKEKAREIVKSVKEKILSVTENNGPTEANVFVPFFESIEPSLPNGKASDMTTAHRLYNYLSILPLINIDKRPRIVTRCEGSPLLYTCPFALFEDFREAVYLMEYSDGVRPYILEWFNEVFLVVFNEKTEPNAKDGLEEENIALTTKELVDTTKRIKGHKYSTQQMYENFIVPLINAGYIDRTNSKIDKRSYIFFPVLNVKQKKLFDLDVPNNFSQNKPVPVIDPTVFPHKQYLISKIEEVLRYSYQTNVLSKIEDHEGKEISVDELVDRYYKDPEDYFESNNTSKPQRLSYDLNNQILSSPEEQENDTKLQLESGTIPLEVQIHKEKANSEENILGKDGLCYDYPENHKITNKLQGNTVDELQNINNEEERCKKLFGIRKSNKLIYLEQNEIEQSAPAIATTTMFDCYYCDDFHTYGEEEYHRHGVIKHPNKPLYPSKADLERHHLKPQGMRWEI